MDQKEAARAVLIEVVNILGAFKDDIVIVGGWVRPLLASGLAREAYEILKEKLALLSSVGPTWAANVATAQGSDFEQSKRSAFEYAQALFLAVNA